MFETPLKRLKRHLASLSSYSVSERTHFPGIWGRRELKESPTYATKKRISPIKLFSKAKCQTVKAKAVNTDSYTLFYCYHFLYAEELFYGHIALLVIIANGDGNFLTKSLKANRDQTLEITHFKFIKKLGSGAFGTVYLAKHPKRDALVAVKKVMATDVAFGVDNALRTMVEKEATSHSYGSPHIVKLLDTFTVTNGSMRAFYFVFEYADGGDLTKLIKKLHHGMDEQACSLLFFRGKFADMVRANRFIRPMTKYLSAQILLGVVALHERGIIHMDLKPANILITRYGVVKIADLGMVKRYRWFHYSARATFLTDVHKEIPNVQHDDLLYVGGTIMYMEPELRGKYIYQKDLPIRFSSKITFSADYFSVGLIIFNILTGFIYGFSGEIDVAQMPRLKEVLKSSADLILVAWYAFKHDLNSETRGYMEEFSIDNISNLTAMLDDGIVSILQATLQPRQKRWSKFTIPVLVNRDNKRVEDDILCIRKMKKRIPLFRQLDFDGIADNGLPEFLANLIQTDDIPSNRFIPLEDVGRQFLQRQDDIYAWPYFEYHLPKIGAIPKKTIKTPICRVTNDQSISTKKTEKSYIENYKMKEIVPKPLEIIDEGDIADFFKGNTLSFDSDN